ncbi:hypothetical protein FOVG_15074 [Fusarium oxysporum f. sp. pisi HDV247]|uniref:DUF6536 domain-containing protein n=1 Tax=Fusarium oxysporum f. sp. pisi HDV247 TaxID=1080344 RepID=W9P1A1_FUSOX|nr:hypothetical protein FOVG_15074 [Fusarium oxysporum f. sp. pisi HDV247]
MGGPNPIDGETGADPNNNLEGHNAANTSDASKRAKWQVSLIGGACACIAVLIINLGVTIWSSVSLKGNENNESGERSSRRIIYEGSCSASRTINVVIHLIINIFGSILLAASNYGMQCLSAPTRADVDQAHLRREWIDIGIPSFRNLRMLSRTRVALWLLLVLSSVPLHLLFNSVVYSSLTTWEYYTFTVDEEFQLFWTGSKYTDKDSPGDKQRVKQMIAGGLGSLDNLTALQCINEYAVAFQTKRSDVLLIVNSVESGISWSKSPYQAFSRSGGCDYPISSDYDWICGWIGSSCSPCRSELPEIRSLSDDWSPWGKRVKYCLSQPAEQMCRVNFDFQIAVVILAVNFVKAVTLAFIALRPQKEPLLVLGDAIQSFLISPDETTTGACLASAQMVRAGHFYQPCTMNSKHKRRSVAVRKRRWNRSIVMYGTALCGACFLLIRGVQTLAGPRDLKSLWDLGFGSANELTLISGLAWEDKGEKSLIWSVLLANLPQLIFSFLYFQYNSLFTCMAAVEEWSGYGNKRRSLRVSSNPRGERRSRYFLQLPYRYSIPLLVASVLMHWMLSQSIFIVAVERSSIWELFTCGYSPIAIIFVIITAVFMATAVFITALRRLPTAMPVAASCSLAIAAACHHPDNIPQPDASVFPLQWGVMWRQREGSGLELTDHCGFSHYPIEKPQDGVVYH